MQTETLPTTQYQSLPTLTELEAKKAEWLSIGLSLMGDLALVVYEFGKPMESRGYQFREYRDGDLYATYRQFESTFLAKEQDYSHTQVLNIQVRGLQVCSLAVTNDPLRETWQNIFVPGNWVKKLLNKLSAAKAMAEQRVMSEEEEKRLALAKRLLIGVSI